ncbi:glycosyltransferase family 39 protein [Singulisphaera sp. PoT]|uniref:glycosyltransferase family 39 protein n=1 Tax=Singulisphaera sp. PoT TaxID=3411797 RepID=UPI003BF58CD5
MTVRRLLVVLVLLAATSHVLAIGRTLLPAQDGLKFLRVARQFQTVSWVEATRGSDQHPLYPLLVALTEPPLAQLLGHGPDTWRIAAQLVSSVSALLIIIPLYCLTRSLFDERVGVLAVFIYTLLPLPAAVGHDTLSDSLALFLAISALALGERSLRTNGWITPLACGVVSGLGYLTRPEVLIVPVAVLLTAATYWKWKVASPQFVPRFATLAITFLFLVGSYAMVKGELSEKLSLRKTAAMGPSAKSSRKAEQWLPPGLKDARWDFSPKEESEEPETANLARTLEWLFFHWAEGLCGVFAFFGLWGVARAGYIRKVCWELDAASAHIETHEDASGASRLLPGPRLIVVYLGLFSLVLVRHALRMGYLSDRHSLTLIATSIPWAAAGTFICALRLSRVLRWNTRLSVRVGTLAIVILMASAGYLQAKPSHASRWGHWAAGQWLRENVAPDEAILDTRGWAAFSSGKPNYDYWHVRQALTDSHLRYIVVGTRELEASSKRAATLRAILSYAAKPSAEFPERHGGRIENGGIRIYRYERPSTWEGIQE